MCLLLLPRWTGAAALHWSGGFVVQKKNGALMRSNVCLSTRAKSCPPESQALRWYGVTTRSARVDVSPEAARRPGTAPGIRKIPRGYQNKLPRRDGERPHKDTNNILTSRAGSRPRSRPSPAPRRCPAPQKQKRSRRRSLSAFPRALGHTRSTRAPAYRP